MSKIGSEINDRPPFLFALCRIIEDDDRSFPEKVQNGSGGIKNIYILILRYVLEDRLDLFLELRDIVLNDVPNSFEVNSHIVMDKDVA